MQKIILFSLFVLIFSSCTNEEPTNSESAISTSSSKVETSITISFKNLDSASTGVKFINTINEEADRNGLSFDYFYNGGGVALADFDNDGLVDIFFCGNDGPNAIYKNKGNFEFENKTEKALPKSNKWAFGVTTVDINNDGFLDLYVCNSGPESVDEQLENELFINNGDFTFTESAKQYGLAINSYSVQAEFFDFDKDGDLDVWINNHGNSQDFNRIIKESKANVVSEPGGSVLQKLNQLKDIRVQKSKIILLRNDNGKYVDISIAAGVSTLAYGLGLSVADFNDDGFLDVYVANDFWVPDYYFINNKNGGFKQRKDQLNHISYYGMGNDAVDYNNDEILDMVVVDMTPKDHYRNKTLMESMDTKEFNVFTYVYNFSRQYMFNTFQVGVGDGYFGEISNALEVGLTGWSWAPLLFDMDNDGFNDLYIANGYYRDSKNQDHRKRQDRLRAEMGTSYKKIAFEELEKVASTPVKNVIYQNGQSFKFKEVTQTASDLDPTFSNGTAYADLDNDGDLDLVINNLMMKASILRNDSKSNNYLKVKLKSPKEVNIKHAKITAYTANGSHRRDYSFTRGYQSCMEPMAYFGLGNATTIDRLRIDWPNGQRTNLENIKANQVLIIDFEKTKKTSPNKEITKSQFVDESAKMVKAGILHRETFFNDFEKEVLLPQKYSSLGPTLAVGDVNNDGLDDFFLGGSQGFAGQVFLPSPTEFTASSKTTLEKDKKFEDIGAAFVDVNGDGFKDLYVASGGGGEIKDMALLQDRIYINNKKGEFTKANNILPLIESSTQAVLPFDLDNDGDMDLFVGGRNVPNKYPSKATSYLLENENGIYKNIASTSFNEALPNMVTDASFADLNEDGFADLIVTGEWSSPKVFINNQKKDFKFREDNQLAGLKGWWYSVSKGDFNQDGKMDFVLGNLGLNNKFHSSPDHPLNVLFDDFDGNGQQDIFLTKKYKNKIVPVRGKECSSEQLPDLNEKFKTYDAFASASIEEILGKDKVQKSGKLSATTFKSIVLINNGHSFDIQDLPFPAQWSPILDAEVLDVNNDGNLDIITAGNIIDAEPETPSYDAGKGLILYGKGDGTFDCNIDIKKSGLNMRYNAKNIGILRKSNGSYGILVANNHAYLQYFSKTE